MSEPYTGPYLITITADGQRGLESEVDSLAHLRDEIKAVIDDRPDEANTIEVWMRCPLIVRKTVVVEGLEELCQANGQ